MTLAAVDLADRLVAALGEPAVASASFGRVTVDLPATDWLRAAESARSLGCRFFDWLTAVDELDQGYSVVCHLWSVQERAGVLLRTQIPLQSPHLTSLTGVYAGAGWHERETYEMFGIVFDGHPHLVPLLLPDGFEGHPLRKEFVLASRVAKEWPGAREPGEGAGGPVRRRMRPPGVPDPADWGPEATPGGPSLVRPAPTGLIGPGPPIAAPPNEGA